MSENSNYFDILKPICVSLVENPSVQLLNELKNALETDCELGSQGLQDLQEYIAFPLKMIVYRQASFSEDVLVSALQCLENLLSRTVISSWDLFSSLFNQLFIMLNSPKTEIQICPFSEETKLAVVTVVTKMVSSLSPKLTSRLYDTLFCPALGHSVFVLLWLSQNEKYRELRIAAMILLINLFKTKLKLLSGDRLAAFLPGISIGIGKIILGDVKQGSAVTVSAINLWSFAVELCLNDSDLSSCKHKSSDINPKVPEVERNDSWAKTTAKNISILVKKIVTLTSHSSFKVRQSLLSLCRTLLLNCKALNECHSDLLEAIIILTADEYSDIAIASIAILTDYSTMFSAIENRNLLTNLEENVYKLTTKLPRILRAYDDTEKQNCLNLLTGYIELLGPNINHVLHSTANLERLILALTHLAQLDTSQVHIIDNKDTGQQLRVESNMSQWPRKYFKHFHDDKVSLCLTRVCQKLGQYGDPCLLADFLLQKAVSSSLHRKEHVLILNEIILGFKSTPIKSKEDIDQISRFVLEEYLSSSLWDISVVIETQTSNDSLEKTRSNIYLKCLLLEGIANIATVMGKEFRASLLESLCPLLEQVGSSSLLVSETAKRTLQIVANCCDYQSTSCLIYSNADYLSHCLSVKLLHFENHPDSPVVLDVVFRLSEPEILPLLEDLILQILNLLDQHQADNSQLFLKVLQSVLTSISHWYSSPNEKKLLPMETTTNDNDVVSFLKEYHKLKQITQNLQEEYNQEDTPDSEVLGEPAESEENPKTPLHIDITLKVLERCVHMQSSSDMWVRLRSLDAIHSGILILKDSENDLLPMVHKIWSPFARRLCNDDVVVTNKAVEVLELLADTCGDFIASRTMTDLWPKLTLFLEKQQQISLGKDDASAYRFTQNYKLQLKLLELFGSLVAKLNMKTKSLEQACSVCIGYLTTKQPTTLALAAKQSMLTLAKMNSDLVWFTLQNCIGCETVLKPKCQLFRPPLFPTCKLSQEAMYTLKDIYNQL